MQTFWQDIRFAARMLSKKPAVTFIAIITLALGIGANTAIFSVVNAVLLSPLPVTAPERLVMVWNKGVEAAGGDRTPLAVADLLDLRAQNVGCESVGAFWTTFYNFTGRETPERVRGAGVTANFFTILGSQASQGRSFFLEEESPNAQRVVIISQKFLRRHFAGDSEVVGRSINLNSISYTIVGVMPDEFDFPSREVELWTAMQLTPPERRGPYYLTGVARLKPGVHLQQARAEMSSIKSSITAKKFDFNVLPINEFLVGDVRPALLVLLAAVTLVLLIAAANVANLMLVRAASREKEISIRAALGASRARIIRQLFTESMLLALVGGLLGSLMAMWGVEAMVKLAPEDLPRLERIGVDARVLVWTGLVSMMTGIFFGLAPALQSSRLNLIETLKEGGRGGTESAGKRRWRNLLVTSEIAMAVMLVLGAGLLINSLRRLERVDPGVNPEQVLAVRVALRGAPYAEVNQVTAFYERVLERMQSLPDVRAAAVSNSLPPDSLEFSDDFTIVGRPVAPNEVAVADLILVSPDYFRALGIPLKRGRYFAPTDSRDAPRVMIINETMARRFFPDEDPIGRQVNTGTESDPWVAEIVGVVGDVKYAGLGAPTQPAIYHTMFQNPSWGVFLSLKTEAADPLSLTSAVRKEIASLDRDLPVAGVSTLEQRLSASVGQPRFRTTLITVFAGIAMVLACIGIYGVVSYSVTQRTHEFGIRLALGAKTSDVLKLVVKQCMALTLAGVLIGLAGSLALTRFLEGLLFGVSASDPATFIVTALLLGAVALLACYLPAHRAARVDPVIALRYE